MLVIGVFAGCLKMDVVRLILGCIGAKKNHPLNNG
jgi:hypothetical protein